MSYFAYARIFSHPFIVSGLNKIKKKVCKSVGTLSAEFSRSDEPIPYADRAQNLRPIAPGTVWGKQKFDCAWFHFTGTVPMEAKGKKVALLINFDGEGCEMDEDGSPKQGLSFINAAVELFQPVRGKRLLDFCDCAEGGEKIDVWVEAGYNQRATISKEIRFKKAEIITIRDDIKDLYYDYLTLALQMMTHGKNDTKFISIRNSLAIASGQLKDFSDENVSDARGTLAMELMFGEKIPNKYYATGHAHLDLAWLWPIRETRRKAGRTLANAVRNIEKYPLYIFGVSQPQQLEWLKADYPKLYEKVATYIKAGRIEPQGKMWVECDTNVTGGESLIRQNLVGNEYWEKEFGVSPRYCHLPDVFGFSGNLPQILKKCGMDYFLTIKLTWNEHNEFPHKSFLWKGIDGSEVMVHIPPEGNYNADGTPISNSVGIKKYKEKDDVNLMGMLYGVGDGGGGPGEGHIECAMRQRVISEMPVVTMAPMQKLFDEMEGYRFHMKTYEGEMYLEKHQGTYTSQARSKYYNRLCERKLHETEAVCTAAAVQNGFVYPYDELKTLWKEVLLYQFHDIIPGSSIHRVYEESIPRYQAIAARLDEITSSALATFPQGEPACYNATSFARKEYVLKDGKTYCAEIQPYATATLKATKAAQDGLDNGIISAKFEKGKLISLVEKGVEHIKKASNVLNVYPDKKLHYNAWDIDWKYYLKKPQEFVFIGSTSYAEGAAFVLENNFKFGKSTLTQKVKLEEGKNYLVFDTKVDWHETHKMLRAEFYPSQFADEVTCDIQFGSIKRSTKNETDIEKAQFEICAQKYVDVSNGECGMALMNDCKYGHRVKDGMISLNCLRSPVYPDPTADRGEQIFSYALYPHRGDSVEANVAKDAILFNNPVIVTNAKINSFASTGDEHVVIETVKMAESQEKQVVIRVYENSGESRKTSIKVSVPYEKVVETDMLENVIGETSLEDVSFYPFEIKTFRVDLKQ